jgi:hypothetical protein
MSSTELSAQRDIDILLSRTWGGNGSITLLALKTTNDYRLDLPVTFSALEGPGGCSSPQSFVLTCHLTLAQLVRSSTPTMAF